jgi:two-component sensor histidine kinase
MTSGHRLFNSSELAITLADLFHNPPQGRQSDIPRGDARFSEGVPARIGILIAVASIAAAVMFRAAGVWVGSDLRFAAYVPAILAIGLLAGIPMAIGATIAVVLLDWAVFFLPYVQVGWLTHRELLTLLMFMVAAASTIWLSHCCRVVLNRLHQRERANGVLAKELDHRNRNFLSVIEVIVRKTLADDPERINKILGRVRAIQRADELLTSIEPHSVKLKALLLREFAPYGEDRLDARGPDVEIEPNTARHLILFIHELVTNAAKYGSLSRETGRVLVDWRRDQSAVALHWREKGGPKVESSNKQGFGSQLVAHCIRALSASHQSRFSAEGFECSIAFILRERP